MADNKLIGARIKQVREEKNITQEELGKVIGLNKSTVQRYETAKIENIKLPVIDAIAKALNVNPEWLSDKTDIKTDYNTIVTKPSNARPLPPVLSCDYYHSVSAGIGIGAEKHSKQYNYWFTSQSQADRCFAVDVEGDSMEPELHDGDVAIVDTDEEPQNDDIVVMYDKADELGYIKRYRMTDNCVMFISLNPAYDTMVFPLSDFTDRIVIHGKVIAVNRKY